MRQRRRKPEDRLRVAQFLPRTVFIWGPDEYCAARFHKWCGSRFVTNSPSPQTYRLCPQPSTSASLAALKKDRKHRLVVVGETLRRLTAKALMDTVTKDMTPGM